MRWWSVGAWFNERVRTIVEPAEELGGDAGAGLVVGFVVRRGEFEAEVNEGLVVEKQTTKNERATTDTCHCCC